MTTHVNAKRPRNEDPWPTEWSSDVLEHIKGNTATEKNKVLTALCVEAIKTASSFSMKFHPLENHQIGLLVCDVGTPLFKSNVPVVFQDSFTMNASSIPKGELYDLDVQNNALVVSIGNTNVTELQKKWAPLFTMRNSDLCTHIIQGLSDSEKETYKSVCTQNIFYKFRLLRNVEVPTKKISFQRDEMWARTFGAFWAGLFKCGDYKSINQVMLKKQLVDAIFHVTGPSGQTRDQIAAAFDQCANMDLYMPYSMKYENIIQLVLHEKDGTKVCFNIGAFVRDIMRNAQSIAWLIGKV